jgi:hypothetical protein
MEKLPGRVKQGAQVYDGSPETQICGGTCHQKQPKRSGTVDVFRKTTPLRSLQSSRQQRIHTQVAGAKGDVIFTHQSAVTNASERVETYRHPSPMPRSNLEQLLAS